MSVGTSTALLIASGIAGGAGIASAEVSAHASKAAAKTQSDAAQQAAAYSQQQTKQAMDYINGLRATAAPGTANSGAYATLSRLTGGAAPMGAPSAPQPTSTAYPNLFGAPAGGAMVRLRAPTGEVQMVPREKAAGYLARGAVQA